ncbi:MAG: DNA photolyase family protein [Alphaproteobacteria bacterium]|nr:DNA photolyase family protein [Alphaproteobacteria bacterium]MBU1280500.1 DNA photolyase family protein [Alphaproteobacteria bacterium]MBU1572216.1 DNA photolyase family protein [Alphaproteobacteria bacterium]MBU1830511.1 DNA photolyase family protein [Alphaproteobacteria bacterium]MBU2078418.1 DNA photolyase family protein [Alphaproteobacteria bacterium]
MTSIWWIRRDFRLYDNPSLVAAAASGAVVPVFVFDDTVADLGAAPKWRMGLGLAHLIARIEALGGRVILRSGPASEVLLGLAKEVGAKDVYWNRLYDKAAIARDTAVKSALKAAGIKAQSSNGHLCFEPWTVETKTGGYYKVYTPFWKTVRERDVADLLPAPDVTWPQEWPASEALVDWQMGAGMQRGAEVVLPHCQIGEAAALARLDAFIEHRVEAYKAKRDFPAEPVCSGLSENLTYGEISPRRIWHAGWRAMEAGAAGAEHFLKELVWREFAYHLLYHEPDLAHRNHREGWDGFDWRGESDDAEAWRRGRTGVRFVDAAMREMYVTGVMHNRARMIVASFLTKHLLTDWRIGRAWFEDCLMDWDPAANAMGWQWVAGCGPDAAPYFRVFNPEGQAEKFDADGAYLRAWIAEGQVRPSATAVSYFAAVPKSWRLSPKDTYPVPIIGLKEGRERALAAYQRFKT